MSESEEIGLMSFWDDLIVLENGERYSINGYIDKLQKQIRRLKRKEEQINKYKQENQSLKDRIEKAIEYIMQPNIEIREYHSCDMDYIYVGNELLEILKGDKE